MISNKFIKGSEIEESKDGELHEKITQTEVKLKEDYTSQVKDFIIQDTEDAYEDKECKLYVLL